MKDQAVSLQWAKALFDQAKAASSTKDVLSDLGRVLQSRRSGDSFWEALGHPLLPASQAAKVVDAAFANKIGDVALRFLKLLAAKRRLACLPFIGQQYERLADVDSGIVRVFVKSAFALSSADYERLEKALVKFYNRHHGGTITKVILDVREDPKLIAGLVVKIGDWVLERSLRSQLHTLKESLAA